MKTIKLRCANCEKEFEKEIREYKRQIKNGKTRFFCGLSCVCIKRNEENPPQGNIDNFGDNIRILKKDEYTPFRWFVLRAEYRDRNKGYGCNLSVEFLKKLWEQQKGICPFTGWNLILPQGTDVAWLEHHPSNASLDRIDNSKGYIEGNVRFIAYMANLARQTFTDDQLIGFCKAVTDKVK